MPSRLVKQLVLRRGNRQIARDIRISRTNAIMMPKPLISITHIPSMSNSKGNPRVARPSQHQNPIPQSPEKIANEY
jgi:hypothetical protein